MLNNTIIGIKTHFDAAHHLPSHKGKCKHTHGHTWHVEVEVTIKDEDLTNHKFGMFMDLHTLKNIVKSWIILYDHKNLNKLHPNPTCENLIDHLHTHLIINLPKGIKIKSIKIQEGEGGWARWAN